MKILAIILAIIGVYGCDNDHPYVEPPTDAGPGQMGDHCADWLPCDSELECVLHFDSAKDKPVFNGLCTRKCVLGGCGPDGLCVGFPDGEQYCLNRCEVQLDCPRFRWGCVNLGLDPDWNVCLPADIVP